MKTVPASGLSSPAITRSSVDLPLPLGPSMPVSEPLGTSTETSSSARKAPYRLVTLRASIATDLVLRSHQRHQAVCCNCVRPEEHRDRVGPARVEVLVRRLDGESERLRAAGNPAGDDADRAELAERARRREHDAVSHGPADRGERDPAEGRERRRAE